MQSFEQLPLPYLEVDQNGKILSYSILAEETFDINQKDFYRLIDDESISKYKKLNEVLDTLPVKMELKMKTRSTNIELFDVHILKDSHFIAHMLFVPKDDSNQKITLQLMELQDRLATTDFELLEKKEELEKVLKRLDQLSGPFIPLSETMCLIPLFGDITENKINAISENCLQSVFAGQYEDILIDFTAVGKLDRNGIIKFTQLIKTLNFMIGQKIIIIGVNPKIAKELNNYSLDCYLEFEHSLRQVLQNSFTHDKEETKP